MISAGFAGEFIVAAAMDQELAPLRSRALPNLQLLKTGIGIEKAAGNLRRCLEQTRVRAVLGIGFAGGLFPELQAGDLVIARRVRGSVIVPVSPELLAAAEKVRLHGTAIHFGTLVTVNQVLGDSEAKRSLAASLERHEAGCVDMESSAISRVCSEFRIPFLIARCITDRANEALPVDFNLCRTSDGAIDPKRVLLSALGSPKAFAGLWRLHKRSKYCAENLALFVEEFLRLAAPRSMKVGPIPL
jgi:adenosylhomocysteine nucleosidase